MPPSPIPAYLKAIADRHRRGDATEHSYRGDLEILLRALLPAVDITNEPRRITDCGAPDYVLKRNAIPLGYIEAKDVDKSLDDKNFHAQFHRYVASLDNFIFTNYLEFRFYRNSETKPVAVIAIAELHGGKIKPLPQNFARFTDLVKNFGAYQGQTITAADDLAARMADKARLLAGVIEKALGGKTEAAENRSLGAQLRTFQKYLISDINAEKFAGVYAQTIAYGLFVARLHDSRPGDFSRRKAAKLIPSSNPFLRKFFGYIADFDLDERIRWIVDDLADVFRATEVDEVMRDFGRATERTDPFLHFYETFLGKYDSSLRKGRGVYYTPEPAVNFIVRAVDSILKKEFGLKNGLADTAKTTVTVNGGKKRVHKVQILDPATGTGTFLADTIKHIYRGFRGQKGIWPDYVRADLIPRLNGFEILMAPYAMAHLKLEMVLRETGCELDGERLRILLTNSLEQHHPGSDTLFAQWLADESREANKVKRDAPLMVVFGNPPYSVSTHNTGEWIEGLMGDYKKDLHERNIQPLSDDYVKFIRYGQFLVEKNSEGVLAYISNNGFIDGLIHRRMRRYLLETFDQIYILDLHGSARKKETAPDGSKDQNVFDIQQGVSINIFVKNGKKKKTALGEVFHCDLFGARKSKYEFLWSHELSDVNFRKLEAPPPNFFFVPKDFSAQAEYAAGFSARALFGNFNSGVKTHRDKLVVAFTDDEMEQAKKDLQDLSAEEIQDKYRLPVGSESKVAAAKKDAAQNDPEATPILYRPFDVRQTLYTGKSSGLMERPRHKTMRHMLAGDNLGLIFSRTVYGGADWRDVLVSNCIVEFGIMATRVGNTAPLCPLYLYPDEKQTRLGGETARKPNLNADIIKTIADKLGLHFTPEKNGDRGTFAPMDILDYIYAALHSPTYRKKFREFLKIDFPRVPFPRDKKQFRALAKLGAELRALHLMESAKLESVKTTYPQVGDNTVTAVVRENENVWINQTQHFTRVPRTAWEFYIGGYQPAQKYLKDRKGRTLTWDEIRHYQKIIAALGETAKAMEKIDKVA